MIDAWQGAQLKLKPHMSARAPRRRRPDKRRNTIGQCNLFCPLSPLSSPGGHAHCIIARVPSLPHLALALAPAQVLLHSSIPLFQSRNMSVRDLDAARVTKLVMLTGIVTSASKPRVSAGGNYSTMCSIRCTACIRLCACSCSGRHQVVSTSCEGQCACLVR